MFVLRKKSTPYKKTSRIIPLTLLLIQLYNVPLCFVLRVNRCNEDLPSNTQSFVILYRRSNRAYFASVLKISTMYSSRSSSNADHISRFPLNNVVRFLGSFNLKPGGSRYGRSCLFAGATGLFHFMGARGCLDIIEVCEGLEFLAGGERGVLSFFCSRLGNLLDSFGSVALGEGLTALGRDGTGTCSSSDTLFSAISRTMYTSRMDESVLLKSG